MNVKVISFNTHVSFGQCYSGKLKVSNDVTSEKVIQVEFLSCLFKEKIYFSKQNKHYYTNRATKFLVFDWEYRKLSKYAKVNNSNFLQTALTFT